MFLDFDETSYTTRQVYLHSSRDLRHHDCRHHPALSFLHLLCPEAPGLYQYLVKQLTKRVTKYLWNRSHIISFFCFVFRCLFDISRKKHHRIQ